MTGDPFGLRRAFDTSPPVLASDRAAVLAYWHCLIRAQVSHAMGVTRERLDELAARFGDTLAADLETLATECADSEAVTRRTVALTGTCLRRCKELGERHRTLDVVEWREQACDDF